MSSEILTSIVPADFKHVAHYIAGMPFGHQTSSLMSKAEAQEALHEYMTVWKVAEQLGMIDLLEHILHKVGKTTRWNIWDSDTVISVVDVLLYGTYDVIDTQIKMKRLVCDQVAKKFKEHITEPAGRLWSRLEALPYLEKGVHESCAWLAETRTNAMDEAADRRDMEDSLLNGNSHG